MKLWRLDQYENCGYDTYDAVVVAAETEEEARRIHPDGRTVAPDTWRFHDWAPPEHVVVEYLGEAAEGVEAGVILASFNAG